MVTTKDLMRTDVYSIRKEAKISELLNLFVEKQVTGVPVVDENNMLVGIISDADILGQINESSSFIDFMSYMSYMVVLEDDEENLSEKIRELLDLQVADLMTKKVLTVTADTCLTDVAKTLSKRKFKKLPVVEGQKLIGTITRGDVIRYLVRQFLNENVGPGTD